MRFFLIVGCILGGLSVGLGAFGAHALKPMLGEYGLSLWEKATYYQMIHALMLIVTSLFILHFQSVRFFMIASTFFLLGIGFFSGSLYTIALTKISQFGIIAPVGGICFMLGWAFLLIGVLKHTSTEGKLAINKLQKHMD